MPNSTENNVAAREMIACSKDGEGLQHRKKSHHKIKPAITATLKKLIYVQRI